MTLVKQRGRGKRHVFGPSARWRLPLVEKKREMHSVRWKSKLRPLASARTVGNGQGLVAGKQGRRGAGGRAAILISYSSASADGVAGWQHMTRSMRPLAMMALGQLGRRLSQTGGFWAITRARGG